MSIHTDERKALFNRNTRKEWQTPLWFFNILNKQYNFIWDMAASKENALVKNYVDEKQDALSMEWPSKSRIWVNFPYNSRLLHLWFSRGWDAASRGSTVIFLVHARTDTVWFHEWAVRGHITFVRGRLKFLYNGIEQDAAPFPSIVIRYDRKSVDFWNNFRGLEYNMDVMDGRMSSHVKLHPRPVKRFSR